MLGAMTQTHQEHPVREDQLAYYAEPGPMTTLELSPAAAQGLPADPLGLCGIARSLIVHEFLTSSLYGVEVSADRGNEVETRPASAIVDCVLRLDARPLVEPRPPERRMIGNCRQSSTLTASLLRRAGIPARARCGFGTYFEAGKYIDHWIIEYWDADRGAWRRVDSQLDQAQLDMLSIDFDATDVPRDRFVPGGDAWQLCRTGRADPDDFGILEFWGRMIVLGDVVRDLASLNKVELLPWDGWGLMNQLDDVGEDTADRLTDEIARATVAVDFPEIRRLYEENDLLRVPDTIVSYRSGATVTI
jgi:Transglutaminase-like superfamily